MESAYRVLLMYDVHPDRYERYYRYMLGEFVPAMRGVGLHMLAAWQVHGDGYYERQVEFVCQTREILFDILHSDQFQMAENRLKTYTTAYKRKIVTFAPRFQM